MFAADRRFSVFKINQQILIKIQIEVGARRHAVDFRAVAGRENDAFDKRFSEFGEQRGRFASVNVNLLAHFNRGGLMINADREQNWLLIKLVQSFRLINLLSFNRARPPFKYNLNKNRFFVLARNYNNGL